MQHKVKLTVIRKELHKDLQELYLADPNSGECPVYNVGDEFLFERYGDADDFWHCGFNTLRRTDGASATVAGGSSFPHCSEAWDCISRYVYAGLQGGAIMRGWTKDERVFPAVCQDATREVVFEIRRLDYKVVRIAGNAPLAKRALEALDGVERVDWRQEKGWLEVFVGLENIPADETIKKAVEEVGVAVVAID